MSSASVLRQPTRRESLLPASTDQIAILGMVGIRCRISLRLEVANGHPPIRMEFAVDSGASYSIINLELALLNHVAIPPPESEIELPMRTAHGISLQRIRPGRIRVWWHDSLQGYPFDWPVLFRMDAPIGVPSILGLGGIIKTCRWTFEGTYSPDAPYGYLTLEDIR